MLSRLEFFATETITSLIRHPAMAFAATACVAAALFVAGLVGLVLLNADHFVGRVEDRVSMVVYFRTPTQPRNEAYLAGERAQAKQAADRIAELPQVAGVTFVTREEGWEKVKRDQPSVKELGFNPLPDAAHVKLHDLQQIDGVIGEVKTWKDAKGKPLVESVSDPRGVINWVLTTRDYIAKLGPAIVVILVLLSLVIIHHTIELTFYARRKEIQIMSLVGATPGTVSTPFALEGLLYGLVGSGFALFVLWLIYGWAIRAFGPTFPLLDDGGVLGQWALCLLIAGSGLGLVGAVVSVTKYLHNPRSRMTNA